MYSFDKMFDFDDNDKLDSFERATQYQFLEENEEKDDYSDDDPDWFSDEEK